MVRDTDPDIEGGGGEKSGSMADRETTTADAAKTDSATTDKATTDSGIATRTTSRAGKTPQSPVVTTAARVVTPFTIAFGIYLTLFGTKLPGGAFQGGVVMGSLIVLIGTAFGFGPTRRWIDDRALGGLFLLGAFLFGGIAMVAVLLGGDVLELFVYPLSVESMVKLVEVAIAALVSGVITGLVIWLAAGHGEGGEEI